MLTAAYHMLKHGNALGARLLGTSEPDAVNSSSNGSDMYRLPQIADRLEVLADWQMGR
jgi:hypothetical protein